MRDELKALDDLEMGDLWQRARSRTPGPDDPDPRRPWKSRTVAYVLSAAALALIAMIVATLRPLGDERPTPAPVGTSPTQSPSATPSAETGPVTKTLVLECGSGRVTNVSPGVEASADGVHVQVISTGGWPEVTFKGWGSVIIDGTRATLALDLPPGRHGVRCVFDKSDRTGDYHPFEVVDPAGLWVDPTLDCPGQSMEVEYVNNEALPVDGDPSDEMTAFTEKEFADRFPEAGTVTPVGYPQAERPYFGYVTPSGSVLGIVGFHEGLPGDWLPEFYRACKV